MMLGQQSLGSNLTIAVHSAANLQDVEVIRQSLLASLSYSTLLFPLVNK